MKERNSPGDCIEWKNKTILVVEDDQLNTVVLQALLRNTGAHLICAERGAEAIAICQNQHVDVVLMDLRLPEMSGYEAARKIREFNKTVPIIGQTAFATSLERGLMTESGIDGLIMKPFRKKTLLDILSPYLCED